MPQISIIVPIYNVEPYLPQCISSLVNQTQQDIEIILVDDGSTDKSGELCDEYAEKDNRIKVIHKHNEGLSAARNDGIDISTSPYIMFVDGDDWAEPEFCEQAYDAVMQSNADLVLFTFNAIYNDGRIVKVECDIKSGPLNKDDAIRFNCTGWDAAWLGLYHRKLFDDIRYPVGKYYKDVGASHKLIHAAKNISFVNEALYNHRVGRIGSITESPKTRLHPDRKEMFTSKTIDLYSWGYTELAQLYALKQLIQYGWRQSDQKEMVDIVQQMKGQVSQRAKTDKTARHQNMVSTPHRVLPESFRST